jgi:hypothetical protein
MKTVKIGDYILTNIWKDKKFKVTKKKTGYKKDCFDTEIGERYFLDNRFKSWVLVERKGRSENK